MNYAGFSWGISRNFVHDRMLHFLASIFSLEVEGNYFYKQKNVKSFCGFGGGWVGFFYGSQGLSILKNKSEF